MKLRQLPYIIAAVGLVQASNSNDASTVIKGVDPANYALYQPNNDGTWTCFDGSKTIAKSAINDDYCDCPDGSDEPGTSACPNAMFYCANKGHIPAYIKSYAVNDGVCDEACCDGSDEDGTRTTCPDRCQEIGEAYRHAQASLEASVQAGLLAKQQLIDEAQQQIATWQEEKLKLEDQIILKKSTLLKLQRDLQKLEKNNKASRQNHVNTNRVEIDTLKHDVTILKKELTFLNTVLSEMKRNHNHNYHDLAVKEAITKYETFASRFPDIVSEIEEHLAEIGDESMHAEVDEDIDVDDDEDDEDENEDAFEKASEAVQQDKSDLENHEGKHDNSFTSISSSSILHYVFEKLDPVLPSILKSNIKNWLLSKNLLVPDEPTSPFSNTLLNTKEAAVENAQEAVNKAKEEVAQLNKELGIMKENIEKDYGTDGEWLKLKDICIEKDEGEYTYSLCFLGDAYQKSNKDSSRTFLGKFEKFDGGEGADKYKVHHHDQGTRCWNGPLRSVRATIECGMQNEILEVTEPQKCEYHYRLKSPAVCQSLVSVAAEAAKAASKEDTASKIAEEIKEAHLDLNNNKKPVHEEL
ncbi:glucosidase II beta subunit-like-domain-containing protein [Mycotypha africana]|uniref:glucosidase II beta subunit-like-domain-containing protein n=1 Tax=Mycotypha africana TaxID=64632 RepID=UPI0022FFEC50|nr:glucosidase II beta subunit-like-domain-containing protein [Mycotypha africana]KAI8966930.1 glucosidase II beta subunit-like-domain-containing protein [Mycotypha africana]